ncbi:LamG-like jellyroll fold domain-containing protein [Anaerotruncus rubiinfantis]|uniref:LamG-like jellyroll fold domain-containing protein n=1 Tax=Anaerotruncus rubiinfantis TaxID=1720200 RepID=UPI003D7A8D7B
MSDEAYIGIRVSPTKLLFHMDNSVVDESQHTVSSSEISYVNGKFGKAANFNGESSITILDPKIENDNNFTIDFWIKPAIYKEQIIFASSEYSDIVVKTTTDVFGVEFSGIAWGVTIPFSTLPLNIWTHVEIVNYSYNMMIFVNGVKKGEQINYRYCRFRGDISIGAGFVGAIDEFRLTTKIARHISNFSPPTTPYTLDYISEARKIRRIYYGVGKVAKKVKRAYIGVGSIAKLIWNGGSLLYSGKATPLSALRGSLTATTIGDYALFAGGSTNTALTNPSPIVDVYNSSLVHNTVTDLSIGRYSLASTCLGNYALFGGGWSSSGSSAAVDAYDFSLTRTTPTALGSVSTNLAATSVGGYALFGGGYTSSGMTTTYTSKVNAYNSSLTRINPTSLNAARGFLTATSVGDYALFVGGQGSNNKLYSTVDAYSSALTKSTPNGLSISRCKIAGIMVDKYALLGGGSTDSGFSDVVDVYNESLIKLDSLILSKSGIYYGGVNLNGYAIFGCPHSGTKVEIFNSSLAKEESIEVKASSDRGAAAKVGNYALFNTGFYNFDVEVICE